jgi:hypothetical protein
MFVFVLDSNKKPLNPTHPARARKLLKMGKAAVLKRYPFTIILKEEIVEPNNQDLRIKIDPGARTTGIAILRNEAVLWGTELTHRGFQIRDALASRRQLRCSRRNRKTRYRQPRFNNRCRQSGWLPPSLISRVNNLCKGKTFLPIHKRQGLPVFPLPTPIIGELGCNFAPMLALFYSYPCRILGAKKYEFS